MAADAYSLKRAFAHVEQMSQSEHGSGFEAHSDVRGYLIQELEKLGLEVLLQKIPPLIGPMCLSPSMSLAELKEVQRISTSLVTAFTLRQLTALLLWSK